MIPRGYERARAHSALVVSLAFAALMVMASGAAAQREDDTPRLTAHGNEPFWSVVVGDTTMTLQRLGFEEIVFTLTDTVTEAGARTLFASGPALALTATLDLVPALCRDTMTGLPYPDTVSLAVDDTVYEGCGGDPMDLLAGPEWRVLSLSGRPVPDEIDVTLDFFDGERVAGTAGCNRYVSQVTLTGEGIGFSDAVTTMMACPLAQMLTERTFFLTLGRVSRFDLNAEGGLILLDGDTQVLTAGR